MTPQELETMRLKMQIAARDVVLEWAAGLIGSTLRPSPETLRERGNRLLERVRPMTFPGAGPAMSDLIAAESEQAHADAWEYFQAEVLKAEA